MDNQIALSPDPVVLVKKGRHAFRDRGVDHVDIESGSGQVIGDPACRS